MSAIKSLAVGLLILGTYGSLASADTLTSGGPINVLFANVGTGIPIGGGDTITLISNGGTQEVFSNGPPNSSLSGNLEGNWSWLFASPMTGISPGNAAAGSYQMPSSEPTPAAPPILAPAATASLTPQAPSGTSMSPAPVDAFLNFGNGPYPDAGNLTAGGAQSWSTSPVVEHFFGGQQPNAQQQADFTNAVLHDVQTTFGLSGLTPKLTLDPSIPANHTLSVVSNTDYPGNPTAIGITNVGGNGFGFIDKLGYAPTLDQLEWAVAHNISHELMHAFGVAVHHDQTGNYLDTATASWALLTDPNTTFSPAAVQDILAHKYAPNPTGSSGAELLDGDLNIVAPVPEPATIALWGLAGLAAVVHRRRKSRRAVR